MPVIKVNLSADGIDRALEELKAYGESVKGLDERVVKRLVDDGVEQAKDLVPIHSGALAGSIVGESSGSRGRVEATAGYAAYVEFGTGVVGSGSPHPNPVGWAYDINGHGEDGWVYKAADGHWYWTAGQPAKPFMYDTAQLLADAAPDVVREELQS